MVSFSVSIASELQVHQSQTSTFTKGVNLSDWFLANRAEEIKKDQYTLSDFINIKSLGIDVVRLPIRLTAMTDESANYVLNPVFFQKLDYALDIAEQTGMNIIIDNHAFPLNNQDQKLFKIWKQIATHCKDRSELIYYELMNEPGGDYLKNNWPTIQGKLIDSIRTVDKTHKIIVTATVTNGKIDFEKLPFYTDANLIYTFHFYKPFLFTHQGAWWTQIKDVSGIPFPYNKERMPECPPELKGTGEWGDELFYNYPTEGTLEKIKQSIDEIVNFAKNRNVKLYCGEFGVYMKSVENNERVKWYKVVTDYLNYKNIPWTTWDYHNAFGLFVNNSVSYNFETDLNVPLLEALGFTVPEHYITGKIPDLSIYSDTPGAYISFSFWPNVGGTMAETTTTAYESSRAIEWIPGERPYGDLGFVFWNNFLNSPINLSSYADNLSSLKFWFKSSSAIDPAKVALTCKFTNFSEDGIPYENVFELTDQQLKFDGNWHKISIPLSAFADKGTYHNGIFYPAGKFSWTKINKLKISTKNTDLKGTVLYFDEFKISSDMISEEKGISTSEYLQVYPTIIKDKAYLKTGNTSGNIRLYNISGNLVHDFGTIEANSTHVWLDFQHIPNGIYFAKATNNTYTTAKIIITK
jgi:endoglucanase